MPLPEPLCWICTGAPGVAGAAVPEGDPLSPLQAAERVALKQVLDQHRWNFTHAALALNISRSTLYLKARKYGLTRAEAC